MTDDRENKDAITGNDPTNGLAGDLEGDDGGAVEPTAHQNVIQDVIASLDPDRPADEDDDSATSYSEEGRP